MQMEHVNWIAKKPNFPFEMYIKIRYRKPSAHAIIKEKSDKLQYLVEFKKPQKAVTAGQSAVFYSKKGEVIGGGIIK